MSLYYRAMGAKIGENCVIGTPVCTAFDLISIGDNSSIGPDTHMLGYRIEDGWLILGNVTIGSECFVGTHCCLGLDTVIGDGARLGDMSHLPDHAVMAAGLAMRGSPAEPGDVDFEHLQGGRGGRRGAAFLFGLIHLGLIWCSFVWLNEVVNGLYESIAAAAMAPLMGTPFISPCLRMMGCRIGKWVFLETTLFSEFDLVEIGDYAALNLGSTIQTHLFEDRVMKADHLKIGEGCSVGNMAVVLYGTEMKRGSSLCALSVLMKGEVVPESSRWIGIPTRPVETSSVPTAAAGGRSTSRRSIRPAWRLRNMRKELLSSSSHQASQYNRQCQGAYPRRTLRNRLIYSASIAAAFCVGFAGIMYYLPTAPVGAITDSQAERSSDSKTASFQESNGAAAGRAMVQDIGRWLQNLLS